jgi:hypothetical protein
MKFLLAVVGTLLVGLAALVPSAAAEDMLFWTDLDSEQIMSMPLDGSQPATAVNIGPAQVQADPQSSDPGSLDYDPATGRLLWPNAGMPGDISWAQADGAGGGQIGTTGNPVQPPSGISLDGANNMLYVVGGNGESVATMDLDGNQGTWPLNDDNLRGGPLVDAQGSTLWLIGPEWVTWGPLNGSGSLDTYMPENFIGGGLSVDRDTDRLYGTWYPGSGDPDVLSWMATDTSEDGALTPSGVDVIGASSTAIDHDTGEIYWANAFPYDESGESRGIFKMPLAGGTGSQVGSTQIGGRSGGLVILKTPEAEPVPAVLKMAEVGDTLTCDEISWAGNRPEAHYFRSPVTTTVAWTRNDQTIPGATGQTVVADQAGTYKCVRTGSNAAGSGSAIASTFEVEEPTPPDPVCPAIKLSVQVSKFAPPRPYGNVNAPGVRITLKTGGALVVSMQPKITFHGKEGTRVGKLRKHQITVHGKQRLRFLLPGKLTKAIAKQRKVRFAPVTFSAKATIWRPGSKDCAQKQDLKLKTKVKYVSKKPGVGLRRL